MQDKRPVIYGEVLFDCFPDGSSILGGAPFNVAWNLQGLGFSPLLISAVGRDALGEKVLSAMRHWGMDTAGIQVLDGFPTGQVVVKFGKAGEPSYEIVTDQAYDNVQAASALAVLKSIDTCLFYHGSLIARSAHSQELLSQLRGASGLPTFVDINLRPPWYQRETLVDMLKHARWVKMNDDELADLSAQSIETSSSLIAAAQSVRAEYGLHSLIVTRGAQGAVCVTDSGVHSGEPVPAQHVIDTVGAGDSFSAVMIAGLISDWPVDLALQRALQFASSVCEMRGATSQDNGLYKRFADQWQ